MFVEGLHNVSDIAGQILIKLGGTACLTDVFLLIQTLIRPNGSSTLTGQNKETYSICSLLFETENTHEGQRVNCCLVCSISITNGHLPLYQTLN